MFFLSPFWPYVVSVCVPFGLLVSFRVFVFRFFVVCRTNGLLLLLLLLFVRLTVRKRHMCSMRRSILQHSYTGFARFTCYLATPNSVSTIRLCFFNICFECAICDFGKVAQYSALCRLCSTLVLLVLRLGLGSVQNHSGRRYVNLLRCAFCASNMQLETNMDRFAPAPTFGGQSAWNQSWGYFVQCYLPVKTHEVQAQNVSGVLVLSSFRLPSLCIRTSCFRLCFALSYFCSCFSYLSRLRTVFDGGVIYSTRAETQGRGRVVSRCEVLHLQRAPSFRWDRQHKPLNRIHRTWYSEIIHSSTSISVMLAVSVSCHQYVRQSHAISTSTSIMPPSPVPVLCHQHQYQYHAISISTSIMQPVPISSLVSCHQYQYYHTINTSTTIQPVPVPPEVACHQSQCYHAFSIGAARTSVRALLLYHL